MRCMTGAWRRQIAVYIVCHWGRNFLVWLERDEDRLLCTLYVTGEGISLCDWSVTKTDCCVHCMSQGKEFPCVLVMLLHGHRLVNKVFSTHKNMGSLQINFVVFFYILVLIVIGAVIPTMISPANSWFPSVASRTRQTVSCPVQIVLCTA